MELVNPKQGTTMETYGKFRGIRRKIWGLEVAGAGIGIVDWTVWAVEKKKTFLQKLNLCRGHCVAKMLHSPKRPKYHF